jgi:hypothetical protein
MPEELLFSKEELHEMHKRMILNGFFSVEQEQGFVSQEACNIICDNALRMLQAMDGAGLCKQ